MTKKDHNLLGNIFGAEVCGKLPYQSISKAYERLESEGLCEHVKVTLPGRFPVILTGWQLTPEGHFAYCSNCKEVLP